MKNIKGLPVLLLLTVAMALTGCAAQSAAGSEEPSSVVSDIQAADAHRKITATEAKERMDSGDPIVIVDVRTEEEYVTGHVYGAILVPNETITDIPSKALPDLDAELLVYCRTGRRSAEAAQKLIDMGYTNVSDFGGIVDWPHATVCGSEPVGAVCYVGNP